MHFETRSGAENNIYGKEKSYPKSCFNYIHTNPVKASLVKLETKWEYSSAIEYAGLRNGSLVNKSLATEFGLIDLLAETRRTAR